MKTPCTPCIYHKKVTVGHRSFIGCSDENMKKGFKEDSFWYRHTCNNQKIKENCSRCKHYRKPYCDNVYSECKFKKQEVTNA